MKNKIIKNIPNAVTISRIISSAIGAILFLTGAFVPSVICYAYAAISDFLDGHLAKKLDAYSDLGRKLDALSDKLFALSLALPAILSGNILMIIPLILEAKIGFHNQKVEKSGRKVYTKRIGKFKTAALFPTMIFGLIASKSFIFSLLFIPSLICSTSLQLKTYNAYLKDEDKDESDEVRFQNSMGCEHEDISTKDKIKYLKKELGFYMSCQQEDSYKPKIKKRDDYSDRY